jgi:hypothetical protein
LQNVGDVDQNVFFLKGLLVIKKQNYRKNVLTFLRKVRVDLEDFLPLISTVLAGIFLAPAILSL